MPDPSERILVPGQDSKSPSSASTERSLQEREAERPISDLAEAIARAARTES